MNKHSFKEWNETMFVKYNNERMYFHPNPVLRFIEKKRVRIALELCDIQSNDEILEVGCGEGYILNEIKKGKIYGIDLSPTAIARAKEKLKNKQHIKKLLLADAESLPFSKNSFDVVLCSEVIEHVQNPEILIKEIIKVAKPNSRLLFTFPNEILINKMKSIVSKTGLFNILLKGIPKRMDDEWHMHTFDLKMFKKLSAPYMVIEALHKVPFRVLPLRYIALCRIKIESF